MQEMQETWIWSLGQEDPLEKEMATHSSILAWKIPWREEPGRLQSMGSKKSDTTEHTQCYKELLKHLPGTLDGEQLKGWRWASSVSHHGLDLVE